MESWIAYTGFDDRYQGHQTTKLYLMNRDGTGSHSVSDKLDRDIQNPQWAQTAAASTFVTTIKAIPKSASVRSTAPARRSPTISLPRLGAGGSGTFSLAHTGIIAITYGRPDNPGDIAISTTAR